MQLFEQIGYRASAAWLRHGRAGVQRRDCRCGQRLPAALPSGGPGKAGVGAGGRQLAERGGEEAHGVHCLGAQASRRGRGRGAQSDCMQARAAGSRQGHATCDRKAGHVRGWQGAGLGKCGARDSSTSTWHSAAAARGGACTPGRAPRARRWWWAGRGGGRGRRWQLRQRAGGCCRRGRDTRECPWRGEQPSMRRARGQLPLVLFSRALLNDTHTQARPTERPGAVLRGPTHLPRPPPRCRSC